MQRNVVTQGQINTDVSAAAICRSLTKNPHSKKYIPSIIPGMPN